MLNKRWLAIALIMLALAIAGLALIDASPRTPAVPKLRLPDAGPLVLRPAPSSFALGGAVLPSAVVTPTLSGACVTGTVTDAVTGAGIPSAVVTFTTFAGALSATADAQGRFELEHLTEGLVSVAEVTSPRHFPFRPAWGHSPLELRLVDGSCVTGLSLSLVPRLEYEGEVLGPDEAPVEGARVTIATEREPPEAPLVTDAQGRFRFHATDGALVVATHPRFTRAVALVDFRVATTRHLTLTLGPLAADAGPSTAPLRGVVVNHLDAGVAGATVRVTRALAWEDGHQERLEALTESAADGTFQLDLDAPGPWRVTALMAPRVSPPVDTTGAPVVLQLDRGATLTGSVVDDEGKAVTAFSVLLQRRLGALQRDTLEPHHVVDPDGRFHLVALPPGAVDVVVVAPGLAPSTLAQVDLTPDAERTLDVRLARGARLTGSVVERGSRHPLAGARVSLEQTRDEPLVALAIARTDERGEFTLSGLPEGRHSLFAIADGHDARLLSVELRSSGATGPVVIDLAPVADGGTPQLELVGIGAVLKAAGDALVIERIVERGGAAEAGLVAGDVVLSIDGASTSTLGFGGSIERIRGAEDTTVSLEVRRASGATERLVVPRRRLVH